MAKIKPELDYFTFVVIILTLFLFPCLECGRKATRLHINDEHLSRMVAYKATKANFKCGVSPNFAAIRWIINGHNISEHDNSYIVDRNKLTVKLNGKKHRTDASVNEFSLDHHLTPDYKSFFIENSASSRLFGIIQCRAELGHQVLLSEPIKLIIAVLDQFTHQNPVTVTAYEGNTAVIPCNPPHSVPIALTEFIVNNTTINRSRGRYHLFASGNLHIRNVQLSDSGRYYCVAFNPFLNERQKSSWYVNLEILPLPLLSEKNWNGDNDNFGLLNRNQLLKFSVKPPSYVKAVMGSNVTLECVVESLRIANISWYKVGGSLPEKRDLLYGNLVLFELRENDSGEYMCQASIDDNFQTIKASSRLDVQIAPRIIRKLEDRRISNKEDQSFDCHVKANPKPKIVWFFNGSPLTIANRSNGIIIEEAIEPSYKELPNNFFSSKLHIASAEYRKNSGIFQCFASNELGCASSSARLEFADIRHKNRGNHHKGSNSSYSGDKERRNRKRPQTHLIPPTKPQIFRYDDSSVMIRWSVPPNNGLPIQFFKIQYTDAPDDDGQWDTLSDDIPPNINTYFVQNLKAGSTYRFRVMAVYANNDNRDGPSGEFSLDKKPNLILTSVAPRIIRAEPETSTTIQLYWKQAPFAIPLQGFIIHYRAVSSAGNYKLIILTDNASDSFAIDGLSPDTAYEFKMQSFNEAGVSKFSGIVQSKTKPSLFQSTPSNEIDSTYHRVNKPVSGDSDDHTLYVVIASGAVTVSILVFVICTTLQCHRSDNESKKTCQKNSSNLIINSTSSNTESQYATVKITAKSNKKTTKNTVDYTSYSDDLWFSSLDRKKNGSLPKALSNGIIMNGYVSTTEKYDKFTMLAKFEDESHTLSSRRILSESKDLLCAKDIEPEYQTGSWKRTKKSPNRHYVQSHHKVHKPARTEEKCNTKIIEEQSVDNYLARTKSLQALRYVDDGRRMTTWKSCNFWETSV